MDHKDFLRPREKDILRLRAAGIVMPGIRKKAHIVLVHHADNVQPLPEGLHGIPRHSHVFQGKTHPVIPGDLRETFQRRGRILIDLIHIFRRNIEGSDHFQVPAADPAPAVAEELAQIISTDAVVTITFTKDEQVYSTYKIPLKNCVIADSDTPITIWEGGHTYNYTIHVEQEAVKFSAAVKSWATVSGSGTATME